MTENEQNINPEKEGSEPTREELIEAIKPLAGEEEAEAIAEETQGFSFEEALGHIFTALSDAGEDIENYLIKKGILE